MNSLKEAFVKALTVKAAIKVEVVDMKDKEIETLTHALIKTLSYNYDCLKSEDGRTIFIGTRFKGGKS